MRFQKIIALIAVCSILCAFGNSDSNTILENYLDTIHFSPEINKLMLDQMAAGEYRMTVDNYEEMLDGMRAFSDEIVNELVVPYEEQGLFNYAEPES